MCKKYSETVATQNYDHVELTVPSQLYDLHCSKTKQTLLDKYFIPQKLLTTVDVSIHCFSGEKKN